MADELSDDERELLEKHRAEKRAAADQDKETWIRQGDNEAAVPYSKARGWLQRTFGIDLDEEPVQDQPEGKTKADPKLAGESHPRFAGRRIS